VLLFPEERLLAVLRWILKTIPSSLHWYLVFKQYVDQVAERVQSLLGGNPDVISHRQAATFQAWWSAYPVAPQGM
jgi:hypothetical protein